MIKGKRKIELSAEEILKRISFYDIFRKYFGEFKINETCLNHLRGEKNTPSFVIGNRYGELLAHDFGDSSYSGNAFQFVQRIHQCSYDEALKIIDRDFNLGIASGELGTEYKKITSQYKQPEEAGKRYSLIQVVTRKFTPLELEYWAQYYQTIEDLRANNVYSIKEVFLNRKKYSMPDDELRFGYLYEGSYWKLYFPYREKRKKWLSNVPLTTMYGLKNLNREKNTLICKSLKDYLVCKKIYDNVCHVQNESLASFSPENVKYITDNSKEVFYGGDNDEPGKRASYEITEAFGWKHINPPDRLFCDNYLKDFADWGRCEGLDKVKEHFKIKKLIE